MTPHPSHVPAVAHQWGMRGPNCQLRSLESIATVRPCRLRQEICWQGQAANYWYRVLAGAASCSIVKIDGRRQVIDLLLPGDYFGMTTCAEYDCTVVVVTSGTVVAAYLRKSAEALVDSNPFMSREIRKVAFDSCLRLQRQLLIVGRITVQQKVGSFLLAMAERLADHRGDCFVLPITRYDIADYLAVAPETVSRALSDLNQRGLIRFRGARVIQIVDPEALEVA